ncbi:MAG TPA: YbjQ family protein [Gemmatimonadaceae bacterium]|nr:YbjQ family protein [Gemmatimonadaceae bacterium]
MARLPGTEFLTTTANGIDGYVVTNTLGVVRGIVVRSRSVFGSIGAKLQTLAGGNISLLTELCERARGDAFEEAVRHAQALGGNALIAVRYDATEIMSGVTEVLCYGTAARVAPKLGRAEE